MQKLLMERVELRAQGIAGFEHRPNNLLQHRMTVDKLAHTQASNPDRVTTELQPKATQDPADAQLQIKQIGLQLLAGTQNGAGLLRRQCLAMDWADQPIRTIWAMPRASLRSVLTGMAERARPLHAGSPAARLRTRR